MSFGATVVENVSQCRLDQCFGQINNVIVIADDILIAGEKISHSNHDQALTTLVETARKYNVCLSYDKLEYKMHEVDFFGKTYTIHGCKPAQTKVLAITEMPPPTCKKQVQSFIGMINYLSKNSVRFFRACGTNQGAFQRKNTLYFRTRTSRCLQNDKKRRLLKHQY